MDVEAIRRYCLSFPDATENLQWGEDLCFKIRGKIFATVNLDVSSSVRIVFKCTPEQAAELIERPGISPAPLRRPISLGSVGEPGGAGKQRVERVHSEVVRDGGAREEGN